MSIRTFRQFWSALQTAAKGDPFANEVAAFVRDHVDMVEIRIGSPKPVKPLHQAKRKAGFPVKILVCEGNRASDRIIGYQSLEFFHNEEARSIEGVVITDVPCERYWLGLAALKFFSANLVGQKLHDHGIGPYEAKDLAHKTSQRLIYRLLDSHFKGVVMAFGRKILPAHGMDFHAFGDELANFLRAVVIHRERPVRSNEEREARFGLVDDAVCGFWHSQGQDLH